MTIATLLFKFYLPDLQLNNCEVSTPLIDKVIPATHSSGDLEYVLAREGTTLVFPIEWLFEGDQLATAKARPLLARVEYSSLLIQTREVHLVCQVENHSLAVDITPGVVRVPLSIGKPSNAGTIFNLKERNGIADTITSLVKFFRPPAIP